jgi:hypothetical protein
MKNIRRASLIWALVTASCTTSAQAAMRTLDFTGYTITYDDAELQSGGVNQYSQQLFDYNIHAYEPGGQSWSEQLRSGVAISGSSVYFSTNSPFSASVVGANVSDRKSQTFAFSVQAKAGWGIADFRSVISSELIHSNGGYGSMSATSSVSSGWVLDDIERISFESNDGYPGTRFTAYGIPHIGWGFTSENLFNYHSVIINNQVTTELIYGVRYIVDPSNLASVSYATDVVLDTFTDGTIGTQFSTINTTGPLQFSVTAYKQISAVPEPETYAMLLAGIVLLCAKVRRARSSYA